MAKKLILGPILAKTWATNIFLRVLLILDVKHCYKLSLYAISRNTKDPNLKKWTKTSFWDWFRLVWPKFGPQKFFPWVSPLLNVKHCCKLSLYAISRKINDPNSRKWWKTSLWAWFRPIGHKFGPQNFFFQKSGFVSH